MEGVVVPAPSSLLGLSKYLFPQSLDIEWEGAWGEGLLANFIPTSPHQSVTPRGCLQSASSLAGEDGTPQNIPPSP